MSSHDGILVHVVFSTKFRKPVLHDDWRDELLAYIGGTIKDHKAVLLRSGGIEDHVHLSIKFHPSFAISSTIQMLKANSSKWINSESKTKQKFQWQSGYGAFSVSQSMADSVKDYIAKPRFHGLASMAIACHCFAISQ
ncbi:IS200/IS605 family transposase [bacterium]|nr:IS200/IS605 family transposase [bacterium]